VSSCYLRSKTASLGEHVEVTACKGEGNGLLHFDGDGLFLLVHIGGLSELDVAHSNIAGSGELDSLLGARNHNRFSELAQILKTIFHSHYPSYSGKEFVRYRAKAQMA
jgi:hypothetical protein